MQVCTCEDEIPVALAMSQVWARSASETASLTPDASIAEFMAVAFTLLAALATGAAVDVAGNNALAQPMPTQTTRMLPRQTPSAFRTMRRSLSARWAASMLLRTGRMPSVMLLYDDCAAKMRRFDGSLMLRLREGGQRGPRFSKPSRFLRAPPTKSTRILQFRGIVVYKAAGFASFGAPAGGSRRIASSSSPSIVYSTPCAARDVPPRGAIIPAHVKLRMGQPCER